MLDVTVPIRNTCWKRLPRLWVYMRVGPNREVRGTPGKQTRAQHLIHKHVGMRVRTCEYAGRRCRATRMEHSNGDARTTFALML